jgi:hypothetical protein
MSLLGRKASRISLSEDCALRVVPLLRQHGLVAAVSEDRYVHRPDVGKGGWSNSLSEILPPGADRGDVYVYVTLNDAEMLAAVEAEGDGDSENFGRLLGIPDCCRVAYEENLSGTASPQNDPVPATALRTRSPPPHCCWNNIAAQYFGYSLLSFAPCSLDCLHARRVALDSFEVLLALERRLALRFYRAHRSHIIYSEWEGVHRLAGAAKFEGGVLRYSAVESTAESRLAEALRDGDTLRPMSPALFEVYKGNVLLSSWGRDRDAGVALFLCGGEEV